MLHYPARLVLLKVVNIKKNTLCKSNSPFLIFLLTTIGNVENRGMCCDVLEFGDTALNTMETLNGNLVPSKIASICLETGYTRKHPTLSMIK